MLPKLYLALPLGLMLCLGFLPTPGFAFPWDNLLASPTGQSRLRQDNFQPAPPISEMGWPIYKQQPYPILLSTELILAENRHIISKFESSSDNHIPVMAVVLYMGLASQKTHIDARMGAGPHDRGKPSLLPTFCLALYRTGIGARQDGLLPKAPGRAKQDDWGMLSFLFKGDGLFSDSAWTEQNFLPRVLSLAVLVVVGLMLVEIMRSMFVMVLRVFHGPDRSH
jgi:hypothetical protein